MTERNFYAVYIMNEEYCVSLGRSLLLDVNDDVKELVEGNRKDLTTNEPKELAKEKHV